MPLPFLIARGETVFHLLDRGRAEPARLSEGACVAGGLGPIPARPDLRPKSQQSLPTPGD